MSSILPASSAGDPESSQGGDRVARAEQLLEDALVLMDRAVEHLASLGAGPLAVPASSLSCEVCGRSDEGAALGPVAMGESALLACRSCAAIPPPALWLVAD